MINLVFSENLYALPKGVERVSIENWTKTREVDEVEEDDKKLNAVEFENIQNIGIGDDKVQILEKLYQNNKEMRSISAANNEFSPDVETYKSNKVLRTYLCSQNDAYAFRFADISSWLKGTQELDNDYWNDGHNGSKYITWPCYSKYQGDNKPKETSAEYRILNGKINLSEDQLVSINKKDVQAILGVSTDSGSGFETIITFNDIINVFINNELASINYIINSAGYNDSKYKVNYIPPRGGTPQVAQYKNQSKEEKDKFCNKDEHKLLSSYENYGHVDLNALREEPSDGVYNMKGNLNKYLTQKK